MRRPRGGPYSQSLISRLEKGHANAPLYTYVHFAEAYDVAPEQLMGPLPRVTRSGRTEAGED